MNQDQDGQNDAGFDVESAGQSQGIPAGDTLQDDGKDTTGRKARQHWRESVITRPGLDDRGDVFFAAIEMTRMPMILTDPAQPDNPIVFANKAFLDLTGYEESEILGRNCRFLQGAQTDRAAVDELRDAIAQRESIAVEILNYKRDGTPFWNAVFIGPVYDTSGNLLYFFASQLDVTRRKESEQAYQQSQKMESIGQLTAGLAHDFNNLLQVVTGNLELLSGRVADEKAQAYLARAQGAAERGAKLTGQLLAFARKTRLDPRAIDVNACIVGFADMLESSLGRSVELHLSLRHGLPKAVLDAEQFEMAILNIALNARDAMPGGGLLTICTLKLHLNGDAEARQLKSGDYVVIELRDEGEGMPEHVAARAAEPFFTTKPTGKGTGLGLSMVHGLAVQLGGLLELSSEVGRGTAATLWLPVATEPVARSPVPAADPAPRRAGARILVVDDDPLIAMSTVDMLEDLGHQVIEAESATRALEILAAGERVDMIMTDHAMPGMTGMELAEVVRRSHPQLPILLATGYADALTEGEADLPRLSKPYQQSELEREISRLLPPEQGER